MEREPDTAPLPAVERCNATTEAIAVELAQRARKRGSAPAGGLFDDTARAQLDWLDT